MGDKTPAGEQVPPVPIKTYRWEDLRRARKRGGYPWTHLDKPSMDSEAWRDMSDHEYEPIAAPPPKIMEPNITDDLDLGGDEEFDAIKVTAAKSETSSTSSRERRFLRIPLDDELVVLPGDGEDEEEAMGIRSMEGENGAAKLSPSPLDERYMAATPTTTTESRTDYDVNTSQLDSSGLEDVPLKKEARKKKADAAATEEARGFQQRLRSQAGRIRSKLRSMPRPNIKLPERPKFNLPERPKFHLPERPKFNLPERPKFHLPERPKFNLPERPKFNLPERPKFHLPERPKFNLPERPKFNRPQMPKLSMPSFGRDRKERPRTSSTRRPLRERSLHSSASTASSGKRNIFDFDFRSYPRIFDRKSRRADYATSSPKPSRGQTPPPQMPARRKGRWLQRFTELKGADEPGLPGPTSEADSRARDDLDADIDMAEGSESTSAFRDKDYGYAVTMDDTQQPPPATEQERAESSSVPESDREARSSGSSSLRRRAGVLEEIDSDEFFLREKGLSQEDVEVGRYLTSEIREAFRAPVSALSQMDNYEYYDDEEDVENLGQQYRSTPDRGPTRPARTRSLRTRKRSSKSKEPSPAEEEFFNTFPPARPKRSRRQQPQAEEQDASKEEGYEQDMEVDEPRKDIPSFTVTDEDGKYLSRQSTEEYDEDLAPPSEEQWQPEEDVITDVQPPMPPKRMRRTRKEPTPEALCNGDYTKEDWLENLEADIVTTEEVMAMRMEPDYIIPAAPPEDFELPPEPPRRGRRKSSRGTSLADEDRTSRGASSLPSERDHAVDDFPCDLSLPEIPGYAAVEKPTTKPRRSKAARPSAPGRRKRSTNGHQRAYPHFYSLPHRPPPIRPLRNYSTLGPSRPPRKQRVIAPDDVDRKSESYIEIEDSGLEHTSLVEESQGSTRDLQSGDIVERMKGRPLPPPPRPPRKGRDTRDMQDEFDDEQAPVYKDEETEEIEEPEVATEEVEPLGALSDTIFYARPGVTTYDEEKLEELPTPEETKEMSPFELEKEERELSPDLLETKVREISPVSLELPVEEVTVATQTDPLPDDVCVVTAEEEVAVTHATIGTETMSWRPSPPKTSEFGQQTIPQRPPTPPPPTVIEKPIPYYVMPDPDTEIELKAQKLQVSELDVERLNVGELQAQKILVSDIDGVSLQVAELTSKSGNLVVSGLELPPGFLQELYDSLPIPAPPPPAPAPAFSTHSAAMAEPPVTISQPPSQHSESVTASQTPQSTLPVQSPSESVSQVPSESTSSSQVASESVSPSQIPSQSASPSQRPSESISPPQRPSESIPPSQSPPESIPPSQSPSESIAPSQSPSESVPPSQSPSEFIALSQSPSESIPPSQSPSNSIAPSQSPSESIPPPQSPSESAPPPQNPSEASAPLQAPSPPRVPAPTRPAPSIPVSATIPLQSIINPNLVTTLDGLHSYIPDYIPPQVRIPSRSRSHVQRELESEEEMISLMHTPSSRRRRHHLSKPVSRYSSDEEEEEEEYSSFRPPSRRPHSSSRGAEPSVSDLSRQLLHACQGVTMRALHQLVQYVAPQVREGEDKRRDLQIALCILLVLVAGLILLGFGSGKTYHHHHWDYHFPPAHP
ncbi:uncharacterized protein [Periplaneta americana]|uniref:uncharacterized protein isoform X2 n=1 Tax=Periplaneta americana TaxID=6978 RepID=UPI0037E750F8